MLIDKIIYNLEYIPYDKNQLPKYYFQEYLLEKYTEAETNE